MLPARQLLEQNISFVSGRSRGEGINRDRIQMLALPSGRRGVSSTDSERFGVIRQHFRPTQTSTWAHGPSYVSIWSSLRQCLRLVLHSTFKKKRNRTIFSTRFHNLSPAVNKFMPFSSVTRLCFTNLKVRFRVLLSTNLLLRNPFRLGWWKIHRSSLEDLARFTLDRQQ